jgi:hypothetical protein
VRHLLHAGARREPLPERRRLGAGLQPLPGPADPVRGMVGRHSPGGQVSLESKRRQTCRSALSGAHPPRFPPPLPIVSVAPPSFGNSPPRG